MSFPQGHALVVGVGRHARAPDLDAPELAISAREVAAALVDLGYPASQVTTLTDADATRLRVLDALSALVERVRPGDTAVIFIAAHLLTRGGSSSPDDELFLAPHDALLTAGSRSGPGIPLFELLLALERLREAHVLLALDTCRLDIRATPPRVVAAPLSEWAAAGLLDREASRALLLHDLPWPAHAPGEPSLFGAALAEALRLPWLRVGGLLSAAALAEGVVGAVERRIDAAPSPEALPRLFTAGDAARLMVARAPVPPLLGIDAPSPPATEHVWQVDEAAVRQGCDRVLASYGGALTSAVPPETPPRPPILGGDEIAAGAVQDVEAGAVPKSPLQASPPPAREQRRFEAAMPHTGQVGRTTEVWVMLSLPAGEGLRGRLPDKTRAGDRVGPEAVQGAGAAVKYAPGEDEVIVYVEIEALDFTPPAVFEAVVVTRGEDAGPLKFSLKPSSAGQGLPVDVHLCRDAETRARLASLTLNIDVVPREAPAPPPPGSAEWVAAAVAAVFAASAGGPPQINIVAGDSIAVGDITGSNGIAIGGGSSASVTSQPAPQPSSTEGATP